MYAFLNIFPSGFPVVQNSIKLPSDNETLKLMIKNTDLTTARGVDGNLLWLSDRSLFRLSLYCDEIYILFRFTDHHLHQKAEK